MFKYKPLTYKGMWHLKFKAKHSDCIYAPKIIELKINTFFYPLGSYFEGKYILSPMMQIVVGNEKQIKNYEKYLKKHKLIVKIERVGRVIFTLAKHERSQREYSALYDPRLFYPIPGHYDSKGYEIWEIVSWDKKVLLKVIDLIKNAKSTEYFELLKLEQETIKDIYLPKLMPKLSKRQQEVFNLAIKEGYYQIPRKINLDKMAKMLKISTPTLQEHLRKAESKIIPLSK